jgi:hypothetical protein
MTARTRRLAGLALVAALLLAIWLGLGGRGGVPLAAVAPASGAATSVLARVMATPASAGMLPAQPASQAAAVDERAALIQRMKADWCGFGAAERDRQTNAVLERAQATKGLVGTEALEEARQTAGGEVMEEAMDQVRRRWVKALVQRGDPRSLAVAAFLGGLDEDPASARARLQALARTTSDPMVTALALQRPCEAGGCRNAEASQWSRLEPANLQAWLALLRDAKGGARSTQAAYALERMAAEGRYSRSYEREFRAVLLSLPQTGVPGLMDEAELALITSTAAGWAIAGYKPLSDACQAGVAGGLSRCEAVLDRLWEADNELDRSVALGLVRRLVLPAHPKQRMRWEPRAREYEAVSSWSSEAWLRSLESQPPGQSPCVAMAEMRKLVRGLTDLGEWGHWRAEMRAARADEAALSAQFRRDRGRGALDPEPPGR